VRLTADGQTVNSSFTVKMDPRVKVSPADLRQEFELETRVASLVTQSSQSVWQARSVHEQLQDLTARANAELLDSIRRFDSKVTALLEGAANSPALNDDNSDAIDLYKNIEKADAAPTAAQTDAATNIEKHFAGELKQWQQLKSKDLPALNQQLTSAGLPEIQPNRPPKQIETGSNEE
jgi:hypothetical protein